MKSKTTIYVLIAAVLVIWGVIAWKLFVPSRVETNTARTSVSKTVVASEIDTLMLDYPDTFLKNSPGLRRIQLPRARRRNRNPNCRK